MSFYIVINAVSSVKNTCMLAYPMVTDRRVLLKIKEIKYTRKMCIM